MGFFDRSTSQISRMHSCDLHGHRYEPRYDLKFPSDARVKNLSDPDMVEAFKEKTYIKDVCVMCGIEVKR